jgi:hypothetical protein
MTIDLVAYAYVEPGGATPTAAIKTVALQTADYLERHVVSLLHRASQGTTAQAQFRTPAASQRFDRLRSGSHQQFLGAANDLVVRLHTAMDNRAKRGFFVALRLRRSTTLGGVLKLDVHDEPIGIVGQDAQGLPELDAVLDVLDLPGELQKGAIFEDPRPDSEVVVGDKVMTETAQYFLRAIEVQQIAAASSAGRAFVSVVRTVAPTKVEQVARTLARYPGPVTPERFFQDNPTVLSADEQQTTAARLEQQTRPVRIIDPASKPLREVVSADGIEIRGPVETMERVSWRPYQGRFRIVIDVDQEPRRRYE